jgi:crotonobetainyl-CoA:carnitine CoA-transferase CaiB-like acyl-CoA transferase
VSNDQQLHDREMFIDYDHPTAGSIKMIGSPIKLSRTPVTYQLHPPDAGEHNQEFRKDTNKNK